MFLAKHNKTVKHFVGPANIFIVFFRLLRRYCGPMMCLRCVADGISISIFDIVKYCQADKASLQNDGEALLDSRHLVRKLQIFSSHVTGKRAFLRFSFMSQTVIRRNGCSNRFNSCPSSSSVNVYLYLYIVFCRLPFRFSITSSFVIQVFCSSSSKARVSQPDHF